MQAATQEAVGYESKTPSRLSRSFPLAAVVGNDNIKQARGKRFASLPACQRAALSAVALQCCRLGIDWRIVACTVNPVIKCQMLLLRLSPSYPTCALPLRHPTLRGAP